MCCSTVDLCSLARQADLLRLAQYAMQTPSRCSSPPVKICTYPSAVAMRQRALCYRLTNDVPLATHSLVVVVVACCCATNAHLLLQPCTPSANVGLLSTVHQQYTCSISQPARNFWKPEQYGVNFSPFHSPSPNWPKPNVGVVYLRKKSCNTVFLL